MFVLFAFFAFVFSSKTVDSRSSRLVINTWAFDNANRAAWNAMNAQGSALDAIEKGCSQAEDDFSNDAVGWGGTPDETGETTLDALIFDGPTHKSGSVGDLRRVRSAISVARKVLEHTKASILVGDQATQFAVRMGFKEQSLTSKRSYNQWKKWKRNNCQPNYWINVTPDPTEHCGPYKPLTEICDENKNESEWEHGHDTIGMVTIDAKGRMAVGTSTNGLKFKISGRVGDSPIPGAGAYVDQEIGGAACTGDGDVTLRFSPTYQVVQNLRLGMDPTEAAESVIRTIASKYPNNEAALIVATIDGEYGAACYNFPNFPYAVRNEMMHDTKVIKITCLQTRTKNKETGE